MNKNRTDELLFEILCYLICLFAKFSGQTMCIIEADFYTAVLNTTFAQGTLIVFITVRQAKVTHTFLPQWTSMNNIIENFVRLKLINATLKKKTECRFVREIKVDLIRGF